MKISAIVTAVSLASGILAAPAALAAVGVSQVLRAGDATLVVTSQREVQVVSHEWDELSPVARLPRNASPLVPDGASAWSVTTGTLGPDAIRLWRISPRGPSGFCDTPFDCAAEVEVLAPTADPEEGARVVAGVAGADEHSVYLRPRLRFDRASRRLEDRHLPLFPALEILQTVAEGGRTWYLAGETLPDGTMPAVRIALGAGGREDWTWSEPVITSGGARLVVGGGLYLVLDEGRVLRYDAEALEPVEDLGPALPQSRVGFFSADAATLWIQTGVAPGTPGGTLWRMSRKGGGRAVVEHVAVPPEFVPLGADDEHLWYASVEKPSRRPLLSVAKSDGEVRDYAVRGVHARRWEGIGEGALMVVTAPLWLVMSLFIEC